MMSDSAKPSARSERVWQRLIGYYGTRITDLYGPKPPKDWCDVVDDSDNETIKAVLIDMRRVHVVHAPTFPQFEALFQQINRKRKTTHQPSIQARLVSWIMANPQVSSQQKVSRDWMWLVSARDEIGAGGQIIGVIVPTDGTVREHRFMLDDMRESTAA